MNFTDLMEGYAFNKFTDKQKDRLAYMDVLSPYFNKLGAGNYKWNVLSLPAQYEFEKNLHNKTKKILNVFGVEKSPDFLMSNLLALPKYLRGYERAIRPFVTVNPKSNRPLLAKAWGLPNKRGSIVVSNMESVLEDVFYPLNVASANFQKGLFTDPIDPRLFVYASKLKYHIIDLDFTGILNSTRVSSAQMLKDSLAPGGLMFLTFQVNTARAENNPRGTASMLRTASGEKVTSDTHAKMGLNPQTITNKGNLIRINDGGVVLGGKPMDLNGNMFGYKTMDEYTKWSTVVNGMAETLSKHLGMTCVYCNSYLGGQAGTVGRHPFSRFVMINKTPSTSPKFNNFFKGR